MEAPRIVIVDFGLGNLPSVQKAFRAVGYAAEISSDAATVTAADGVMLPGVGAFGAAMAGVNRLGLAPVLQAFARSGRPFAGTCVGMQLLFEVGEEFGETPGLGLIPGRVTRLPDTVKLPQIGWNEVRPVQDHPVFAGLPAGFYCYFVHSYAPAGVPAPWVAGVTDYGRTFPAVVARENVLGFQFHPEKSSTVGLTLLRNWAGLVAARAREVSQ